MIMVSVRPMPVPDEVKDMWRAIREWATASAPWALIVWWIVVFVTGGLHPQNQVQYEQLAIQVNAIHLQLDAVVAKLDASPRQQDYTAWNDHMHDLDGRVEALGARLTADEIRAAAAEARAQRIIDDAAAHH